MHGLSMRHCLLEEVTMQILSHKEIETGLHQTHRVYLTGNLKKQQKVPRCISSDGLEIGTSFYDKYTVEDPHVHSLNNEYNFVLSGQVKVLLIKELKEYLFVPGDMFLIEPGDQYITKALAGSQVLFVKSPGGNDKRVLEPTDEIMRWSSSWEVEGYDV